MPKRLPLSAVRSLISIIQFLCQKDSVRAEPTVCSEDCHARSDGGMEAEMQEVDAVIRRRLASEVVLIDQASVSDDKLTVGQLLKRNGVTVKRFVRFAAGA